MIKEHMRRSLVRVVVAAPRADLHGCDGHTERIAAGGNLLRRALKGRARSAPCVAHVPHQTMHIRQLQMQGRYKKRKNKASRNPQTGWFAVSDISVHESR